MNLSEDINWGNCTQGLLDNYTPSKQPKRMYSDESEDNGELMLMDWEPLVVVKKQQQPFPQKHFVQDQSFCQQGQFTERQNPSSDSFRFMNNFSLSSSPPQLSNHFDNCNKIDVCQNLFKDYHDISSAQ